jgi:hypothetical protein
MTGPGRTHRAMDYLKQHYSDKPIKLYMLYAAKVHGRRYFDIDLGNFVIR